LETTLKECITRISSSDKGSREASCLCLKDIITTAAVQARETFVQYIDTCYEAVKSCLNDESWTIREASILTFIAICEHYPSESAPHLDEISNQLFSHLSDSTYNVRVNAARAICVVIRHHPASGDLQGRVEKHIAENLMKAKTQQNPEDMERTRINIQGQYLDKQLYQ